MMNDMIRTDENGVKWRKIDPKQRKKHLIVFALGVIAVAVLIALQPYVDQWATRYEHQKTVERLEPSMRVLADAGKPSAILWLATNVPNESKRLHSLVNQGNADAMYALASLQYTTNPTEAKLLIAKAAALGQPIAVDYQLNHAR